MHAEMNALLFCKDIMQVDVCYATTSPCIQCVKALLQSSCRAIIFETLYDDAALTVWLGKLGNTYTHLKVVPDENENRTTRPGPISEDA